MKVYLNGEFVEKEDAKVSVFDHGFLYGDGVFEGIRLYSGNIFKLEEHLIRLEQSAKALLLSMPVSRDEMRELVCESCRVNGLTDGYIRLIVTRGVGSLGLSPRGCGPSGLVIIADTIELFPKRFYEEGLKIVTVPTRRLGAASLPPMVKSLNYLNNILAK
ncbi:MAG: aminotransferase class IV, partial [Puniceicoccales bacterium]